MRTKTPPGIFRVPVDILLIVLFSLAFASWLMFHTFSYDPSAHTIQIAFKLWSDFGAHIPLIRSFSMGDNLNRFFRGTVEYPIFPNVPIRYHYLFYMIVGILERVGIRIDWALNVPSILGFAAVMVLLYCIAKLLFQNKSVGLLTVIFFLFNGSFGFLKFFSQYPLSTDTVTDILHARAFPAFAPWGPGMVTAFWNLNIYTNQRHLAPAFAIVLAYILIVFQDRKLSVTRQILRAVPWGIVFGIFPWFHPPALLITALFISCYFFFYPRSRIFLLTTGVITASLAIVQFARIQSGASAVEWYPGYIFHNELLRIPSLPEKIRYMADFWWQNMGLHSIMILAGLFVIPRSSRRAFVPLVPLFLIPNFFKFSVEASANHKFFNFVMMMSQMITAGLLVWIWENIRRKLSFRLVRYLALLLFAPLVLLLTLSGIIDFFVVKNDTRGAIPDIPFNREAAWIAANTPPDAVFLNSGYLYQPASIAGRPIYLGWPYFAWSAGYKENRANNMTIMYENSDTAVICPLFSRYRISFITAQNVTDDNNLPKISIAHFLKSYTPVYVSDNGMFAIFSVQTICKNKTPSLSR